MDTIDTDDNGSGDQSTGSDEVVGDQDQRSRAVSDTIADVIVCETDSGVKVSGINIVNEGHLVDGVGSDFPTVGDHNQCSRALSDIATNVIVCGTDNTLQLMVLMLLEGSKILALLQMV